MTPGESSAEWMSPGYVERLATEIATYPLQDLLSEIASWEPLPVEPWSLPEADTAWTLLGEGLPPTDPPREARE